MLASLNIKRWKIPSGEITNLAYLRRIGFQKQPVILSTGMANLGEIEAAIDVLSKLAPGEIRSRFCIALRNILPLLMR